MVKHAEAACIICLIPYNVICRTSDVKALYAEVDVEVAMLMKDSITSSRGFQEGPSQARNSSQKESGFSSTLLTVVGQLASG